MIVNELNQLINQFLGESFDQEVAIELLGEPTRTEGPQTTLKPRDPGLSAVRLYFEDLKSGPGQLTTLGLDLAPAWRVDRQRLCDELSSLSADRNSDDGSSDDSEPTGQEPIETEPIETEPLDMEPHWLPRQGRLRPRQLCLRRRGRKHTGKIMLRVIDEGSDDSSDIVIDSITLRRRFAED